MDKRGNAVHIFKCRLIEKAGKALSDQKTTKYTYDTRKKAYKSFCMGRFHSTLRGVFLQAQEGEKHGDQ